MTGPCRFWADLSSPQLAALDLQRTIAVLPLAATEQHGPHLPLCVDRTLADGLILASLSHLPDDLSVLFLPTQAIGFSPEHSGFAGTLTLKTETLIRLWTDIGESVAATGVQTLVLLNSHGGQVGAMDLVARDLRARLGLLVFGVNTFELPLPAAVQALFDSDERRFGVHAGQFETALMLALRPDLVQLRQARHFVSSAEQRARQYPGLNSREGVKLGWHVRDLHLQGAVGNAAAATVEQGQAVLAATAQQLARVLVEIAGYVQDRQSEAGQVSTRHPAQPSG